MARIWTSGFESKHYFSEGLTYPGFTTSNNGTATFDTGNVRVANTRASLKFDSGASPGTAYATYSYTTTNTRYYYFRFYVKLSSADGQSDVPLFRASIAGPTAQIEVRLNASNQLQLYNANASSNIGSPSAALNNTDWYRVEIGIRNSGAANTSYAELKLNGTSVASSTTVNISTTVLSLFYFGWITAPTASESIWFDDSALNDNQTGGSQTSWPGVGEVWLILPTSDNTRGTNWYCDNAATSNLFDALNNTPPVGVAHNPASMAATAQIYNIVSGTGQNSDYNMQTYDAVGIPSDHDIILVQMSADSGTNGTTGRSHNAYILSNPAESAPSAYTTLAVACGTYPDNSAGTAVGWKHQTRTVLYAPTVTRGTAPVGRVQKNVANVAAVDFCFAGILVESAPPLPGTQYTLYGSDDSYGAPLANASQVAQATGGAEIAKVSSYGSGTANQYGEFYSQGGSGLAAVASIPATPTGHGWLWPIPSSGTFGTDTWTAAFAFATGNTGMTAALTVRYSKYVDGVGYTLIGSVTTGSFTTGAGRTVQAFTPAAFSETTFTSGEYLYVDAWYTDDSGLGATSITCYTATNVAAGGVANDAQFTTAHFIASGATYERAISGVSVATQALGLERSLSSISAATKAEGLTCSVSGVSATLTPSTVTYERALSGISGATQALGLERVLSSISAATQALGLERALSGVSLAVQAFGIERALSSVSLAVQALGLERSIVSVSGAIGVVGATYERSVTGVSVALQTLGLERPLVSVSGSLLLTTEKSLTGISGAILPPYLGYDTFTRADQSGWGTADDGQTWNFDAGGGTWAITGNEGTITNGAASIVQLFYLGTHTASDVEVLYRYTSTTNTDDIGCPIRGDSGGHNYVRARVKSQNFYIRKRVSDVYTDLASMAVTMTANTHYWIRFRAQGPTLFAKYWQDGTSEPADWMLTASLGTDLPGPGYFGLNASMTGPLHVASYDHYSIRALPGERVASGISASIAVSSVPMERAITGVSAAASALGLECSLTSISGALQALGLERPIGGVSTSLIVTYERPLVGISGAVSALGVSRPLIGISVSVQAPGVVLELDYYGGSVSEPAGASTAGGWHYSRDDTQAGVNAVPVPTSSGQNFSWYKQFAVTTTTSGYSLSNFTVKNTSDPPDGIHIYWKASATYVQATGVNKPDDIVGAHNTSPAGYTLVTTSPQQWYAGPVEVTDAGRQGDFLLLVLGVGDDYAGDVGDQLLNTVTWTCEKG